VKDIKYPFQISMSVSPGANRNPEAAVGSFGVSRCHARLKAKKSVEKKSLFLDMLEGHRIHDRYLGTPLRNIFSDEKNSAIVFAHVCNAILIFAYGR
jgi:hypothetical protein